MKKYLLILIIIIAAFLRFFQLGTNPPSLTWDEVAWGYNAYTIGIDGRDEFGKLLPYDFFESFGDFKPPVYTYLTIIPVWLFGLNEFAVRFASAFFGTLTVLVTYFLVKVIFISENSENSEDSENRKISRSENQNNQSSSESLIRLINPKHWRSDISEYSEQIALVTAGLLAFSPWHIMLSRAAFEANVATFFLVSGVWLFLEAIQKRPWMLSLAAISFVLSVYTFNTTRIVAPLLVIVLALLYWKKLLQMKTALVSALVVGIIAVAPTVPFLLSPQAKLRFMEVNIFSDIRVVEIANQEIINDNNAWWSNLIHNRRVGYGINYLSHYFDNLSFDFLFISGDENPKFSVQSVGQLYLWEFPFLIAGILFLFRKREGNWKILPLWLLLGIIPAATARETPHALRIETTLPTFQIFVAYGIINVLALIKNLPAGRQVMNYGLKLFTIGYLLFAIFNVAYYFENYYVHYAKKYSHNWQYGYREAVLYMYQVQDQYDALYLTPSFGRPYIYTLFYTKYDPVSFRNEATIEREALGFVNVHHFGKYYFDKALIPDEKIKNTLYIDTPGNAEPGAAIKKTFYLLNGEVALVAYTL